MLTAEEAYKKKEAIALEDINGIRKLYRKGNWQGRKYRGKMNSWSFFEAQRQIEYKAKWKGIPIIHLSKGETRGTSLDCPRCGERLQLDRCRKRELWCPRCRRWMDHDVVAVMNQSRRGWVRFAQSLPNVVKAKGEASEAMVQERGTEEEWREPL